MQRARDQGGAGGGVLPGAAARGAPARPLPRHRGRLRAGAAFTRCHNCKQNPRWCYAGVLCRVPVANSCYIRLAEVVSSGCLLCLISAPPQSISCTQPAAHTLSNIIIWGANGGAALQVDTAAVQVKFFERAKGRVFHHPSSVNFNCGRFESGWLVYTDMVQTSKVRSACQWLDQNEHRHSDMIGKFILRLTCTCVEVGC